MQLTAQTIERTLAKQAGDNVHNSLRPENGQSD